MTATSRTQRRGDLVRRPAGERPTPAAHRRSPTSAPLLDARHEALHVANRLAFGPTPELVAELLEVGGPAWIEQQLDPASIDDHASEAAVRRAFPFVDWSAQRLRDDAAIEGWQCPLVLRLATLMRAVHSRRQLLEVMTWFWNNHFSIHTGDGVTEVTRLVEDGEVVRRHALGRFEDLLLGSARSPAMLAYLDNENSRAPDVNENYARELMELHTLGVDGGYTEVDVRNAARVLAGWTIDRDTWTFRFEPRWHDDRPVRVLGLDLPAGGGVARGEALLRHLAHHPSTARFLATKLVRWFVGEQAVGTPLVQRVADAYLASGTDVRATLRAIFASEAFWTSQGAKLHAPFSAFAKALRAVRADLGLEAGLDSDAVWSLHHRMELLGQGPSAWEPPNGYPDADGYWTSPGLLVQRWNLHGDLARDRQWGSDVDVDALVAGVATAGEAIDHLCAVLTCRRPTAQERAVLATWVGDPDVPLAELDSEVVRHLVALVLSLPAAQRR